jgi:putative aldouronate transport system permease protein
MIGRAAPSVRAHSSVKTFRRNSALLTLALPGLLSLFLFAYLPMFGIFIAFKDINYSKGLMRSDWIGFKNFSFFFRSQDAFRITRNTILYNLTFIIVGISLAVFFAMLLYDLRARHVQFFQTVLFVPYFLSWVVVGYIAYIFLNPTAGLLNQALGALGLRRPSWYIEKSAWPFWILFFYLWKNLGYNAIIFYTGLMSVDVSLFEAASIDGANRFQLRVHILLPLLRPLVSIMAMLAVGRIMYADFGLFYFIPRDTGMLYSVTDVIDTYVYRSLRVSPELGMSSAAALYQSVMGCVLVVLVNFILRKVSPEDSLF